jgi:hypothetical protein
MTLCYVEFSAASQLCFLCCLSHCAHFTSSVHIMTHATYCQISVLNVTKIQYINLLDETHFYVFLHCWLFVVPRARVCMLVRACVYARAVRACVARVCVRARIEILLELHQQVIISKLFHIQWKFQIISIHFIEKKLKLHKFKVLINHATHVTKYFFIWSYHLLPLTSTYT